MEGKDPAGIIRDAIAKALVFYYPFAGRLREYGGRKLAVECTGEGAVFVEADADVTLEMFGKNIHPPFQNQLEELLFPTRVSSKLFNSPVLAVQVTRLRCGGFISAYGFNHIMCDGAGISQFMSAVGELARGAAAPSIPPVWDRHLLSPIPDTVVPAPADPTSDGEPKPFDNTVHRNFFLDAADISALRRSLPPHLQSCTRFEVVAACAWRCWAIAMSTDPDEEIVFTCIVDIRKQMKPPLPEGYYGNAVVPVMAFTTAEKISKKPLRYAVELVRKAKSEATHEYVAGLIMKETQPRFPAARAYGVSTTVHLNFDGVDLGWGRATSYGGLAKVVDHSHPLRINWYIPFKDKTGQQGVMVPACLPLHAMEVFATQLHSSLKDARTISALNKSAL